MTIGSGRRGHKEAWVFYFLWQIYRIDILLSREGRKMAGKKTMLIVMIALMVAVCPGSGVHGQALGPSLTIVQANYDPHPVPAGEYFDLWIKIENTGSQDARDTVCVLEPEYPFVLDPDEEAEKQLGTLGPHESVLIQYRVRTESDAPDGWHEMELKCKTGTGDVWVSRKMEIVVESQEPELVIGSIDSDPKKILPDTEENMLTVEIQNIGTGSAENVVARLVLPEGFEKTQSYSDVSGVGTIPPGESRTATYYIDVDKSVRPGDYEATLVVKYKPGNTKDVEYRTINLSLWISVKPTPLFSIQKIETVPAELQQGARGEVHLVIRNEGSQKAESVSVRIYKEEDQPFDFDEKYDYVGTLEPGQEGEAVYRFSIDDDANLKTYILRAEIRYLVDDQVRIVEESIPLRVSREKGASPRIALAGVICLVGLAGIVVYYARKKKES